MIATLARNIISHFFRSHRVVALFAVLLVACRARLVDGVGASARANAARAPQPVAVSATHAVDGSVWLVFSQAVDPLSLPARGFRVVDGNGRPLALRRIDLIDAHFPAPNQVLRLQIADDKAVATPGPWTIRLEEGLRTHAGRRIAPVRVRVQPQGQGVTVLAVQAIRGGCEPPASASEGVVTWLRIHWNQALMHVDPAALREWSTTTVGVGTREIIKPGPGHGSSHWVATLEDHALELCGRSLAKEWAVHIPQGWLRSRSGTPVHALEVTFTHEDDTP